MPKAYRLEDAYNNFSSEPISSPNEFREHNKIKCLDSNPLIELWEKSLAKK